jgi:hypothetical protein
MRQGYPFSVRPLIYTLLPELEQNEEKRDQSGY